MTNEQYTLIIEGELLELLREAIPEQEKIHCGEQKDRGLYEELKREIGYLVICEIRKLPF